MYREHINKLRPSQNARQFPDHNFMYIFLRKDGLISIQITLKFHSKGPIHDKLPLIQVSPLHRLDVKI